MGSWLLRLIFSLRSLIASAWSSSPVGAFTGVLGLALALFALYHWRGPPKPPDDDHHAGSQYQTDSRGRSYHSTRGDSPLSAGPSTYHRAAQGAAERAAKSLFGKSFKGSHSISISVLGIIIEETSPELLADGASVMQDGITVIQETLLGQRSGAGGRNKMDSIDAYLICHVVDDVGQAVVRGALEHAGLVGYETNQIPPQRLLFCETKEGKGSLVRALEVDLHIDSDVDSIEYLQRFVPRLVHVAPRPLIDTNRGDANSSSASIQKKEIMDHSNVRHVRNLVEALYG